MKIKNNCGEWCWKLEEINVLNTIFLDGVCDAGDDILRKFIVPVIAVNKALNSFMCPEVLSCVLCVVLRKVIEVVLFVDCCCCAYEKEERCDR